MCLCVCKREERDDYRTQHQGQAAVSVTDPQEGETSLSLPFASRFLSKLFKKNEEKNLTLRVLLGRRGPGHPPSKLEREREREPMSPLRETGHDAASWQREKNLSQARPTHSFGIDLFRTRGFGTRFALLCFLCYSTNKQTKNAR